MNYEILSIETTKHIAELEEEVKDLRILTGKGIRKQLTINKAIRYLENVLDNQHLFKRDELLDILIKVSYILKER